MSGDDVSLLQEVRESVAAEVAELFETKYRKLIMAKLKDSLADSLDDKEFTVGFTEYEIPRRHIRQTGQAAMKFMKGARFEGLKFVWTVGERIDKKRVLVLEVSILDNA